VDSEIGLSVVDRFSHKFFEFVKESTANSTIQNFIEYLDPIFLGSTPIYRGDLFDRPADKIKIFDFVAAKSREDIESGIEGCDVVYNKVVQVQVKRKEEEGAKEEDERTCGGKSRRRRRVYKIDFEATQLLSNNLTLLITLTFITAGYFLKSTL
jgi:glycosylphosphatidylinositol transamidase (GPIT) subunit GPI8